MILQDFSEYYQGLDSAQRQQIVNKLLLMISSSHLDNSSLLEDVTSKTSVSCSNCESNDVRANGKYKTVQRYNCKSCKKYFRDTTGKLVFGLKKPERFPTYLYHMLMGLSIEKYAKQTGIYLQTSFDWRHKVLSSFDQAYPEGFQGIVESDDIFFLESEKGFRDLEGKPRKRGSKATKRGICNGQIALVVSCDRIVNKELRVTTKRTH